MTEATSPAASRRSGRRDGAGRALCGGRGPVRAAAAGGGVGRDAASGVGGRDGGKGPVRRVGAPTAEPAGSGLVRVRVPVTFERGGLTVIMSVDERRAAARPAARAMRRAVVGAAGLRRPGAVRRTRGHGWLRPAGRAGHAEPAARGRPLARAWCCSAAAGRSTVTRPAGRTNRSRTWPGAWPAAAWRCCASTRSTHAHAGRWPTTRFHADRRVRALCRRRRPPAAASSRRSTRRGSSCSATAWAARSPRASRPPSRRSPAW